MVSCMGDLQVDDAERELALQVEVRPLAVVVGDVDAPDDPLLGDLGASLHAGGIDSPEAVLHAIATDAPASLPPPKPLPARGD